MPLKNKVARATYQIHYRERRGQGLLNTKRAYWKERRLTVLTHYSNGLLKCSCCGETTYEFLCLDHVDGGGNDHRRKLGSRYIYSWLITQGFPSGYQVLCHNCNQAKGFYGLCPHKRREVETTPDPCGETLLTKQFEPDADQPTEPEAPTT